MLDNAGAEANLRGRLTVRVLMFMERARLEWLEAWLDRRDAAGADGYLYDLAARSPVWDEDALRSRAATGHVLHIVNGSCLWDSRGDVVGEELAACEASVGVPGLARLLARADEQLYPSIAGRQVHVSRLSDGSAVVVID